MSNSNSRLRNKSSRMRNWRISSSRWSWIRERRSYQLLRAKFKRSSRTLINKRKRSKPEKNFKINERRTWIKESSPSFRKIRRIKKRFRSIPLQQLISVSPKILSKTPFSMEVRATLPREPIYLEWKMQRKPETWNMKNLLSQLTLVGRMPRKIHISRIPIWMQLKYPILLRLGLG